MPGDRATPDRTAADDAEASHEAYFRELNDGCGCTEIWEFLSERRRERAAEARQKSPDSPTPTAGRLASDPWPVTGRR